MTDTKYLTYEEIGKDQKTMLMSYAAHWLSLKPELIGDIKSDKELIDRLMSFAKVLYEYFPQSRGGYGEAPIGPSR
jgi:hypothetical protein